LGNISGLSRRAIIAATATAIASPPVFGDASISPDADLINLGNQFDQVAAKLDRSIEDRSDDVAWEVLARFDKIESRILGKTASTIDGLRVKARAACWALLGDLESPELPSTSSRMGLSIVRDLIRVFDPHLEHPDALKDLIPDQ
jgi:hypothetical protein